jgi:hypothetical protein
VIGLICISHSYRRHKRQKNRPPDFPSGRLIRGGGALARIEKLSEGRLLGRFYAASRARLREVAAGLGVHHLASLAACPIRSAI